MVAKSEQAGGPRPCLPPRLSHLRQAAVVVVVARRAMRGFGAQARLYSRGFGVGDRRTKNSGGVPHARDIDALGHVV